LISVIVLGAGAGGGFPQWNSNAPGCRRARAGDPAALPRTQTSVAVSADRKNWFLLNAAPDLRAQIERTPELHPTTGLRSSPIAGVALAGAEVDAVAGLLTLREGHAFSILATQTALAQLDENPIFEVLARAIVQRVTIALDTNIPLALPDGAPSGLTLTAFATPGKTPLYKERAGDTAPMAQDGSAGLEITDGHARLLFVPGCATMSDGLRTRFAGADALFLDSTLWTDDEMERAGIAKRTGQAMGHMSISGPDGVLATLAGVTISRRVMIHINNTNPILLEDSAERATAEAAGWQVAYDGMRFEL
jgi:pyrroloquinoline quinone biosynthesis protein B